MWLKEHGNFSKQTSSSRALVVLFLRIAIKPQLP